jgi:hypothetical protein
MIDSGSSGCYSGARLAALLLPRHAADDYPSRPVTVIVSFTLSGSTEIMARHDADGSIDHWLLGRTDPASSMTITGEARRSLRQED